MQVNGLFHGFRVKSVTELDEIKAKMWRMEYEKNGADLIWFEREDANANMTFGIGFKTVPEDDTGVFHIIEHSVLCGSEKYPVKEPFVELIKSSVNTFLNAFTYNDKTVYPVASRNGRDFLNLIDVYLDAVFHPLSIKNPLAFRQEGWHWDFDAEGKVTLNGVVYSEMKGAYASADRILSREMDRALFPDNCYSKESGGDPGSIPDLTYEQYLACHRRFYSATNAKIFLDGMIDTEAVFEKLDSFLSEYDRIEVDADIPMQKPVDAPKVTAYYPIGTEEDPKNKTQLLYGRVFADYSEREKQIAASLLFNVLAGTNEAPLKKAVIGSGLAEDVSLSCDNGILQESAYLKIKNTEAANEEKLLEIINSVFTEQLEKGIDKDELEATLNAFEFSLREKEDGLRGLSIGLDAYDAWLYGGDPASVYNSGKILAGLRSHINDGSRYFENLLREIWFDCPHRAAVCLLPSVTLAAEQAGAEEEKCTAAAASWSAVERKKNEDDFAELKRFQDTEDYPEDLEKLPSLKLSDLNEKMPPVRASVGEVAGVPLLSNPQDTNGIIYGRLMFNLDDFDNEELRMAMLVDMLIGDLATKDHTASQVLRVQKRDLGHFYTDINVLSRRKKPEYDDYGIWFSLNFAALEVKAEALYSHIEEVLNRTLYTDGHEIAVHIKQRINYGEQGLKTNAIRYGRYRASSLLSPAGYAEEILRGFDSLVWLRKVYADIEKNGCEELSAKLAATAAKIINRSRARLSITANVPEGWTEKLVSCIPAGEQPGARFMRGHRDGVNEGIEIPAAIGFGITVSRFDSSYAYDAASCVAEAIISYAYLWNEVRVHGGAYGCGISANYNGQLLFYSYRDPQPAKSLEVYTKAGDFLREIADSGDFENFIISVYGSASPLLTPRSESETAEHYWLTEGSFDRPQQIMKEILSTDADKLRAYADMLDKICDSRAICVVGGHEQLLACGDKLGKITPMS